MFKATVENLDSSISPRSVSIVESRTRSSGFSSPTGSDFAVDEVSNSPKGVTEDVDDRSVALLNVGVRSSLRESVSRGNLDWSSSSTLCLSESDKKQNACQRWSDGILSLNGRTELGTIFLGARHPGQLSKRCRDFGFGHQELPLGWKRVRFMVERRRCQSVPTF